MKFEETSPTKKSEMENQLLFCTNQKELLMQSIDVLEKRLDGILRKVSIEKHLQKDSEPLTPLANSVRSIAFGLENAKDIIQDITSRLEI